MAETSGEDMRMDVQRSRKRYDEVMPKKENTNPHLPELRKRVADAPQEPGVYRWMDSEGTILYIGKAKNLRNRLKSYVQDAKDLGPWKDSLVRHIADVDTTVTNSELEALILETNLIKEVRPKYNVMMKDDKNYVYIRISVEDPYPSVEVTRTMTKDGAKYFGPFLTAYETRRLLDMLQDVFNYRENAKALEQLNKAARKGDVESVINEKPSLDYQIGQSCGVAIGKISREEYIDRINNVLQFLKGDRRTVMEHAKVLMAEAAEKKQFERAASLRDTILFVDSLNEKQMVSDTTGENSDFIGVAVESGKAQVVLLKERGGKMIGEMSFVLAGQPDTTVQALSEFIPQYYSAQSELPDRIVIAEELEEKTLLEEWLSKEHGRKVEIRVPERGKKSQLLTLAEKNAEGKLKQQAAKWEAAAKNIETALKELKEILNLPEEPKRIEGYDISHLGGTETVGSMVVIKNGKAANDQYRSFTIRTMKEGEIDDYKALREVLKRRLLHLIRDVKQEEKIWKERGVAFSKVRKKDAAWFENFIKDHDPLFDDPAPDSSAFLVARNGDDIVATVALRDFEGVQEISTVWVDEKFRGQKLGQFIVRKALSTVKKGKVYLMSPQHLQSYYMDIGFRHIHNAPKPIQKLVEINKDENEVAMMFDTSQNKKDSSLSSRPDLLMIDGGKGQLGAAVEILKELKLEIPAIGLAKREEEVFVPGNPVSLLFPKDSQGLFLLMRLRNEAHRFANRHREKRLTSNAIASELDAVPGLGPKTKKELLNAFGTVSAVREATDEQLLSVLTKAQLVALRENLV